MKKSVLVLLVAIFPMLCGCTDYKEIDRGYLITAIGFGIEEDDFTLSLETISSSDVTDKPSEAIILSGSGKTVDDAYAAIEKQLVKPLYFQQLGAVVIDNTLNEAQIKQAIDFYKNLPLVNYGIYLVKTNDITTLFNSETDNGVLGYDIIGIIKNFEKRNQANLLNQLFELNRNNFTNGIAALPTVNTVDGRLELIFSGGGQYE